VQPTLQSENVLLLCCWLSAAGFCELNTANLLYWTYVCRGCFAKDVNVDRPAACCSGATYRNWIGLQYCT
jgi:hypothetical protein